MREKSTGFIFWVVVFCSLGFCSSDNDDEKSRQTFVIRYKDGEQTIPVTVVLDYKKQTEYVINMNPRTPAKSVTLYDFKQRTIAYKDLTNRECFLGRLTHETLSEEVHALQDVKNPVEGKPKFRSLDPRRPALTPTEIRNIAGQKTAVFCRKMNTWLLMPDRPHGISKREADEEFEERTLHYQGHRSTQYSHYQRETRRRYRNRGQATNGRRAQRNKSAVDKENRWLPVPEPNPHQPRGHFAGSSYFNPGYPDTVHHDNNHSSSLPEHPIPYNSLKNFEDDQGNGNNGISFENSVPLSRPHNVPYPIYDSKLLSSSGNSGSSRYFNPNTSDDIPVLHRGEPSREHHGERNGDALTEGLPITTETPSDISSDPRLRKVNYPNVHPSLAHLLPVYKPLSQEFDHRPNSLSNATRPNIESELHLSGPVEHSGQDFEFPRLTDGYNTSHDPDVSVNILEVPRVSKKFENAVVNGSHDSIVGVQEVPNAIENHPPVPRTYFRDPLHSRERNPSGAGDANLEKSVDSRGEKLSYLDERKIPSPQSHASTTTSPPVLTTPAYLETDRTTSPVYVPSVHTAFQNSEDFNSFQIFPSYSQNNNNNNNTPSFEKNLTAPSSQAVNIKPTDSRSESVTRFPTTQYYPPAEGIHGESSHRSDIPSEDGRRKSPSSHHHLTYPSFANHSNQNENVPPYRTRYQSALRHFKPDEIIIDVENVPTHNTLPPVTSSYRSRIPTTTTTTVRPTFRGAPSDEQILGSSHRTFYPVTRHPRRRVAGDKVRRPIQHNTSPFVHPQRGGSLYQNNYPEIRPHPQVNQLVGVNRYAPSDRRQIHYPSSRPHPVRLPAELNHLHHPFGPLGSLPPGVSMHPRHPQAPFADMIRSNRPPTLPLGVDHPKHRQRHHRKKDRHSNSCCRLRGKSGAFQSCCRNGGPCCSLSQRRPGSTCCSSSETIEQSTNQIQSPVIRTTNQIQPPVVRTANPNQTPVIRTANPIQAPVIRTANPIAPPIRDEEMQRSDPGVRCQKEKMCRTVYESTQQVMVCRNAHVEGC